MTATMEQVGYIPMSEAVVAYGKTRKTIAKYIEDGCLKGMKIGGMWLVEQPALRAQRLYN